MRTDQGHLRVAIASSPGEDLAPFVITVTCEHGRTRVHWRRTCANGCHQGPLERSAGCARVNPAQHQLAHLGVVAHQRRLGCPCGDAYWMAHGPIHGEGIPAWAWEPVERQATSEDYADLEAAGPAPDPWEPVC